MDIRAQRVCAWSGIACVVIFLGAFGLDISFVTFIGLASTGIVQCLATAVSIPSRGTARSPGMSP